MPRSDANSDELTLARSGSNQRALAKELRALTGLNDQHAAVVQHAKTLARLVDTFPFEIKVHSEYREVLKRLHELGAPKRGSEIEALLKELRSEE